MQSPWLEFVDFEGAQYDISLFAAEWRKLVSGRPQFGSHSPSHRRSQLLGQRTGTDLVFFTVRRNVLLGVAPPAVRLALPVGHGSTCWAWLHLLLG